MYICIYMIKFKMNILGKSIAIIKPLNIVSGHKHRHHCFYWIRLKGVWSDFNDSLI